MRASHLEDLYSFLRFPSVSTDDDYSEKLTECAHWLVQKLTSIGLETKLVPTPGHPVVWAKNKHQPGRRTVEGTLSAALTTVLRASAPVRLVVAVWGAAPNFPINAPAFAAEVALEQTRYEHATRILKRINEPAQ